MKKIFVLVFMVMSINVNAQSLETLSNYPSGYMETSYFDKNNTIQSVDGVLYMLNEGIPIVLVKYPAMNPREEYEIPSTVRRINNNAFQGTKYLKTLKIHIIVTSRNIKLAIGESAFNDSSIENFIVIENDQTALNSHSYQSAPVEEIARYDVSGRKVGDDYNGVQIISYTDHSTKKILTNIP